MIYYDEMIEDYKINPCVIAFLFTSFIYGIAWAIITIF